MKFESFSPLNGKEARKKKKALERTVQAAVGLTVLASGGIAIKEIADQSLENGNKIENNSYPIPDFENYEKTINYEDVIQDRIDFSGNQMSKVGVAYAEFEAQAALNNFSEIPYGNLFDLYRYYFGQPLQSNILSFSKYKPTNSKDSTKQYIAINDSDFLRDVLKEYHLRKDELPIGETIQVSGYKKLKRPKNKTTSAIGGFLLGHSKDEKGEYISYYDLFDVGTGADSNTLSTMRGAKAFEIYDRIYLDIDGNPIQE